MASHVQRWRIRWRHALAKFKAGPDHLAGSLPRQTRSRVLTVLVLRWLRAFVTTHFTAAGAVLFLLSLLFAAFVMDAGRWRPAHLLPLAILVLFVVNGLLGWLAMPRLQVERSIPGSVMMGDTLPVEYRLRNIGRVPLWCPDIEALPLPSNMHFVSARPSFDMLAPGKEARLRADVIARRRGRYVFAVPRVDSAFPFHLWRWGHNGAGERKVVVYPSFTPLRDVDMSFGLRYQPGGVAFSSHIGSSMEFLSCREFRTGDDPRHLHSRSWARLGTPVVREFREEYLCRTALVLDTYRRHRVVLRRAAEDAVLEAGISLSAAVADYLASREYLIEFFAAGSEIYRFDAGRSLAYLEDILDVLSCIEPSRSDPFATLSAMIESDKLQMSSAILILLTWDSVRADLVRDLMDAGVAVKVVLLHENHTEDGNIPAFVERVAWTDIRDGQCTVI